MEWEQTPPNSDHVNHPTKGGFRAYSPSSAATAVMLLNNLEVENANLRSRLGAVKDAKNMRAMVH